MDKRKLIRLGGRVLMVLGAVFLLYCAGTVSVVWLAPESALADQLTGPLTISGTLTAYGDIRTTTDLDVDVDINCDGDGVVDGSWDMNIALADTVKPGTGVVLNIRATDGQDDAIVDAKNVWADNLRIATTVAANVNRDTTGLKIGTFVFTDTDTLWIVGAGKGWSQVN